MSDKIYVPYHMHSDLSNGVTNIDSVTKYTSYIEAASGCGMKAMAFSEHGSIFEWYHKKCDIEKAGMKYIHAIECYVTINLEEKIRDNMHCVLIAKNYDGFLELNKLVSESFNRKDNHFYYVPRISFNELLNTSDNIIITTACIGGILGKGNEGTQKSLIEFGFQNKDRFFLEIGHHIDDRQKEYNRKLLSIHQDTGIRLIAGTDTHALNDEHATGRKILQQSKGIHFEGEDTWDLTFKTYDQLVAAYENQGALECSVYLEAIDNTNVMAEMVEEFKLDTNTKYPKIYANPEETFRKKVYDAIDTHPYALKNHKREDIESVVEMELSVYNQTKSIDFMLMQTYLREWEKENDIQCGYGRGSVSGSMVAYLLGITQMDSMRFGLNFFRFMNPSRVTNADIDSDYSGEDRDKVKQFILKDKMNLPRINSAEIITFNTIALKGAIRDVCRALYRDNADVNYIELSDEISKEVESHEEKVRKKYPDVFKYVDIVNGTIVSIGTHPSGVLISDLPLDQSIGLCSISTSEYPVSMINMKELDALMYVKLDILGLDNIGCINEACKMIGIDRITPDNVDLDDEKVWKSIRDDTTLIFQWESDQAGAYIRKIMSDKTIQIAKSKSKSFSMLKWFSFANGLLRPGCASFRDEVANGIFYDNGFEELNEFLAPEAGRIAMQETIMQFLVRFCGYTDAESDNVRRAIAKKKGTESLLPEIERRFIEYSPQHYNISAERCAEVIKPFIQIILDASSYSFSWNHSDAYACIGYISAWLRYYYPLEFLTASLNIFADNKDKTADIAEYVARNKITITTPKWGISRSKYYFDKDRKVISKGISSIKYMSSSVAEELFEISKSKRYTRFIDALHDISSNTSINTKQIDILIKIDFFSEFGNQRELLRITDFYFGKMKKGEAKSIRKEIVDGTQFEELFRKHCNGLTKSGGEAKSYTILDPIGLMHDFEDKIKAVNMPDLSDIDKMKNFADVMGYAGYTSGKEADRKKLYIQEIRPVCRKSDGKQFGYSVATRSLGSGKEGRFTVFNRVFDADPIKQGDIVMCTGWERDKRNPQYYQLTGYSHVYS